VAPAAAAGNAAEASADDEGEAGAAEDPEVFRDDQDDPGDRGANRHHQNQENRARDDQRLVPTVQ